MADTESQTTMTAAVTSTEGGIGSKLMRSFTPLNPDNIEDNTLSSLLELSRTCEALQQKNRSSPQTAGGLLALENNRNSPKPSQNGAYLNNIDRNFEQRLVNPVCKSSPLSLNMSSSSNQNSVSSKPGAMSVPSSHMERRTDNCLVNNLSPLTSTTLDTHRNSHHSFVENDEDEDDDMYYDDEDDDDFNDEEEDEDDKPAMAVTQVDTVVQKSSHSRRKPKSPQHYLSFNSDHKQTEDNGSARASDLCQQDMWTNNIDEEDDEGLLSDGESFDGKIVYNPDGSAFIIEGESDLSDSDSLLDVPHVEGSIVDHRGKTSTSQMPSFPQIANAFYIHKNPSTFYNSYYMYPPERRPKVEAPIMHSFKVYDLRSQKENLEDNNKGGKDIENAATKALLNSALFSEEVTTVPTKPILMCFICKLSFGYTKSFMAHAVGEHGMSLNEQERSIMMRKNASAIIQGLGKDKEPLMSFLEPTSSPKKVISSEAQSSSSLPFLPPPLFKTNSSGPAASPASSTNVSYVYSNAKVTSVEHVSKKANAALQDGSPKNEKVSSNSVSPHAMPVGSSHQRPASETCHSGTRLSPITSDRGATSPMSPSCGPPALLPMTQSPHKENASSQQRSCSPRGGCEGGSHCSTPKRIHNGEESDMLYRPYDISESPKSLDMNNVKSAESRLFTSTHKLSGVNDGHHGISSMNNSSKGTLRESPNVRPSQAMSHSSMVSAQSSAPLVDDHGIVIRSGCEDHPHGNISGVDCLKCDQILGSSRSLGGHMTMMHSRNSCKTLKCPKCNWHYKYQETLEIHMKEKHPENDTQCIYCLTNQPHPRLARGEVYTCGYKPYRCEICNYSTTTKGNLSIHMQSDKHINNMQEIQTGQGAVASSQGVVSQEIQMPVAQPPPQPLPPPPPSLSPDANAMKKNKPKPTWRCDVCNYETNVARNLRIHMTSEKHTHNMLVLQQNVKHMQRDMQFQMSQLALMGQDPLSIMAGLPPGFAPGLPVFPFDQMFMGPMPGAPGMPQMIENPMDLSKQENGMIPNMPKANQANFPMDLKNNNNETSRIFQCSVCNIFSTDSLESLHQHMQLDRQKVIGEQDDSTTVVGGTYMCNLCQYKTNLKANFQLHCKTDKHLQRLQLVNHIREGGPANEWRLKYMSAGNPVQVRCNSCDYYTNSVHKLQLHRTNPRHETNAQLFHHLQTRETCLSPDAMRYFTCTLCGYNTRTKISLIQHIHNMSHMRNESLRVMQLKEQGKEHEYVIENIFQVKEYTESDLVTFDEPDGDGQESSTAHDGEYPDYPSDALYQDNEHKGGQSGKISCPFCTFVTTNEMQIQLHVQTQHMGPHATNLPQGGATEPATLTLRCPLCQEKCRDQSVLEKHLFQVHNVSPEGMHRLLSMVFTSDKPHNQSVSKNRSSTPQKTKENSTVTSEQSIRSDCFTKNDEAEKMTQNSLPSPVKTPKPSQMVLPSDGEVTDPMELQAEMMENQALKLAEEASMEGVVLADKDSDDHYRCQTCTKTFANIDALYSHQNELGHLELKQTPRGPGYLCWKKGCNQYFKTADALQNHFREIHARTPIVSISERHAYKFRCTQCSLAFKTLDKLQLHSYYHIIRAATKCVVCGRSFRSIAAMRKHVESMHMDTMTHGELEQYKASLASIAPLGLLGMPMMDPMMLGALATGQMPPLIPLGAPLPIPRCLPENITKEAKDSTSTKTTSSTEPDLHPDEDEDAKLAPEPRTSTPAKPLIKQEVDDEKAEDTKADYPEPMDDETSSQPDPDSKDYKDQQFFEDYINSQAIAENSYSDPTRKFKCHRCKVAFTRQNYLSAHNKTLMHRKGDKANCTAEKYMDPNRPYKCEVCRESFTQKNILLVHYNSVSHLHKLKLHQQQHGGNAEELPQTAENGSTNSNSSDNSQPENPALSASTMSSTSPSSMGKAEENKPYKCNICKVAYSQSATMDIHIRSVLHQTRTSKLQELAMTGQIDLSQPLIEQPDATSPKMQQVLQEQQRKALQEASQALHTAEGAHHGSLMSPPTLLPMVSLPMPVLQAPSPVSSNPSPKSSAAVSSGTSTPVTSSTPQPINIKTEPMTPTKPDELYPCQMCNAVFANQAHLTHHQKMVCYAQPGLVRGMPRYKQQVQRSLLENFGFEHVMQFNEFNQKLKNPGVGENDCQENKTEDDVPEAKEEGDTEYDMPEINKCRCTTCKKEFSSIWVLKAHQEEVHQQLLPIEYVEEFSIHFKDQYDKKQQLATPSQAAEAPSVASNGETSVSAEASSPSEMPVTSSHGLMDENMMSSMPHLASEMAMAQAMQMMQMPMLMNGMLPIPMNMPMNMMPMMPMMMPMGPEMFAGMPMMDPNMMMAQQQQQHQAAALAAQQQKRARTRINDEQLKILRAYFDINNSPTEEQIMEMADKSGLPAKVIKHWFRNTLFKERQRNKDSPYNFSVPPSTSLNLEEYEKTGKISEAEREAEREREKREKEAAAAKLAAEKAMIKEEEEIAKKRSKEREDRAAEASKHAESAPFKPKIEMEEMKPQTQFSFTSQGENRDRQSVNSLSDSMRSSAPSTPVSTPSLPVPGLGMPHMMPPHPGLAGLPPPGVSFAEFSAALQHMPMPPAMVTSAGQSSASSTSQHSTANIPRSMPNVSPSHHQSMQGKRANRTRFTDYQIKVLQEYFEQNAYPKDDDLEHLSRLLNLSPRVIVVWFQNARQKARKNYENQPPLDMSDDGSKFTRTPGLNYQCKKCFTVFQRYYELIKHQRTHCYKDDKKLPFSFSQMMGQSSTSFGESSNSDDDSCINEPDHSPRATSTPKSNATTPTPTTPNNNNKGIEYKCEKCNLVLPRLELWREHQNIHNMNPSLFGPFSNNAFAMLQNVAQQPQSLPMLSPQPSSKVNPNPQSSPSIQQEDRTMQAKRKLDEEDFYYDSRDDQPRDKRMRTTILPEQLDYLYQKYQIDCNPSRKQLENIASEVGLKKRVVQVWFQNTRARERKGQFRAHQQIIHKRCPFCRALFRAKSALESHLATKHPEEMSKGEINIDNIPDDPIPEGPSSPGASSVGSALDMAKLLNNPYNMPGPMMPLVSPPSGHGSHDQVQSNMKKLYEDSLKHYLDELSHASHQPKRSTAHSPEDHLDSSLILKSEVEDVPLDLSKPHGGEKHDMSEDMHSKLFRMDDKSETHSEVSEREDQFIFEYSMPDDSNPPSPTSSTSSNQMYKKDVMNTSFPHKRYRTQMSSTQIKVMKHLFTSYKTPTMTECELVGREIGLPKRVIQVWFQNARAKEKKAKLNYMKTFGGGMLPDLDFQRPPEECKLCKFKYSHKYTVQDHIFTNKHIENVRQNVIREMKSEKGVTGGSSSTTESSSTRDSRDQSADGKAWSAGTDPAAMTTHPHLAQLHAMGLHALSSQGSSKTKDKPTPSKIKQEPKETDTKETRKPNVGSSGEQMMSPFPGMPGFPMHLGGGDMNSAASAGLLPYLYPGLNGMFPGMPMMPGMIPGAESMMYDPTTFGTPLTLLQIPQQSIQDVQAKVQDPNCTLTRYTQDCRTLTSLKKELTPSDASLAQATYLDVGFICKQCHMVYPGKEACVSHQMTACFQGTSNTDMILKLEQLQYRCAACDEKFSLTSEYRSHVKSERHVKAARRVLDNRTPHDSRPSSRASIATPPSVSSRSSSAPTPPKSTSPRVNAATPPSSSISRASASTQPLSTSPLSSRSGTTALTLTSHSPGVSPIVISPKPDGMTSNAANDNL